MKAADELAEEARAVAESIATSVLGAPVRARIEGSAQDWHQTLRRQIFEQRMTIWKPFSLLDLIVGVGGEVLGYIDHEAYRNAGPAALTDEEVRVLVIDDELLPPRTRVVGREQYPGPEGGELLAATVEGPDRRRWLVEINCARRLVAAIRPLDPGAA